MIVTRKKKLQQTENIQGQTPHQFSSWKPVNKANLDLWDICNCIWFTIHCHYQMSISCTQKVQQVKQINHAGNSTLSLVRNTVCSLSPWPCRSAWSRAAWLQQNRSYNGLLHYIQTFLAASLHCAHKSFTWSCKLHNKSLT